MKHATTLVTGGTGFLGAALVRALVAQGRPVRVLDNNFRGSLEKLGDCADRVEFIEADIRSRRAVDRAARGCDTIYHLACVNGTRYFYERPDLVLGVGVEGTLNVVEACRKHDTRRLVFASSSEVYQQPDRVPTPEDESARIPDVLNPRYSYAGVKLIGELMVLHMLCGGATEPVIFRPHNIYGPAMGFEHVLPQFILRLADLKDRSEASGHTPNACHGRAGRGAVSPALEFPIQGDGSHRRSFCYIDDAVAGMLLIGQSGEPRSIYHLGTQDEITIAELANQLAGIMGLRITLVPGPAPAGQTSRRCPDIPRLRALGYTPKWPLRDGLIQTVRWYTTWMTNQQPTTYNKQQTLSPPQRTKSALGGTNNKHLQMEAQ